MNLPRSIVAATCVLFAQQALCASLFAPFSLDSASVLPKGVGSVRFTGFTSEVSNDFANNGSSEHLGSDFAKSVTWAEAINATAAGPDRGRFKGGLEALGVDMNSTIGNTRGLVDARVAANVPTLAFGVTPRLTVGIAAPIVYSNLHVSTGWTVDAKAQDKLKAIADTYFNKEKSYEGQLYNVVQTKLASAGYEPLSDQQRTGLGDVVLAAKYQAYKKGQVTFALSPKVVLPTGRRADVNKIIDLSEGGGVWDVGMAAVVDYQPQSKLTINSSLGYTAQWATNRAKRIPFSGEETITPDIDYNTHQKLGDMVGSNLGLRYLLHPLWTVGTGYSFQYKMPDSYRGTAFAADRYRYLESETEQYLHAIQFALSYNTVPLYAAHKFEIPLDVGVNFTSVLAGRNVKKTDLTAIEVAAYF
jgi:hypothetical protein